jgi:hypothetical protein
MKTATVPAQVTSVEDKIAGNLTLQQMVLLASPVFIDFALYVLLPTAMKLNTYKLILMVLVALTMNTLAIRFKSKLFLAWAITIFKYNKRPRYYVYNKNNSYLRIETNTPMDEPELKTNVNIEQSVFPIMPRLSQEDIFRLEGILANPSANLRFATNRKGGLHVSITEIK